MVTLWLIRRGHALVPMSRASAIEMEGIKEGAAIRCDVKRDRNSKHHRMVFALFTYTAKALNDGPAPSASEWTAEDVARLVKFHTGHVEKVRLPREAARRYGADYAFMPASISYAKMGEDEFAKFADAAVSYVADELCPWLRESEWWPHVDEIVRAYRDPLKVRAA